MVGLAESAEAGAPAVSSAAVGGSAEAAGNAGLEAGAPAVSSAAVGGVAWGVHVDWRVHFVVCEHA